MSIKLLKRVVSQCSVVFSTREAGERRVNLKAKIKFLSKREAGPVLFMTPDRNTVLSAKAPAQLCLGTQVVSHNSHPLASILHTETLVKNIQTEQHAALKFMNSS